MLKGAFRLLSLQIGVPGGGTTANVIWLTIDWKGVTQRTKVVCRLWRHGFVTDAVGMRDDGEAVCADCKTLLQRYHRSAAAAAAQT